MATEGQGNTNPVSGSCVAIECSCSDMWSIAQDFAHRRMATLLKPNPLSLKVGNMTVSARFLEKYNARARRIAATYARLYLETEQHGDITKKGRYYWMALGAFASKTVACALEHPLVLFGPDAGKGMSTLAKGNLWLFYDVTPWHWAYSLDPASFSLCKSNRNAQDAAMHPTVKRVMTAMPWAKEALPTIGQFKRNKHIDEAFDAVKKIEALPESDVDKRPKAQLKNLMAIAEHEQGVVLQPLIYEDTLFTIEVAAQRLPPIKWIAPPLELVFAAACETPDPELKSVAPEGTKIEVLKSRMEWINKAALKFHRLMQDKKDYMEAELKTIASWVDHT